MDCAEHRNAEVAHCPQCLAMYWKAQYDSLKASMGRGEPVGYVFRRSICSDHDPADCEEYDDFVSRADVGLEELAEYEKHGMVMEVYAKAPAVDDAVLSAQDIEAVLQWYDALNTMDRGGYLDEKDRAVYEKIKGGAV